MLVKLQHKSVYGKICCNTVYGSEPKSMRGKVLCIFPNWIGLLIDISTWTVFLIHAIALRTILSMLYVILLQKMVISMLANEKHKENVL